MALKDGKPWIAFGTPGSDTQPQTQLQFFLNVAEFGMNVQEALEQPAVISNSFRDSYYPHAVLGKLLTPAMLPERVRVELHGENRVELAGCITWPFAPSVTGRGTGCLAYSSQ